MISKACAGNWRWCGKNFARKKPESESRASAAWGEAADAKTIAKKIATNFTDYTKTSKEFISKEIQQ
jgi:hypothetical protein